MTIITGGGPIGGYDVTYYSVRGGRVYPQSGFDRDLSLAGAERQLRALKPDEIGVATCQSSPGSMTGYGSERARDVYLEEARRAAEHERREAQRRLDALERPWALPDETSVRVRAIDDERVSVEIGGEARTYRVDEMYPSSGLGEHVDAAWSAMRDRAREVLAARERVA